MAIPISVGGMAKGGDTILDWSYYGSQRFPNHNR